MIEKIQYKCDSILQYGMQLYKSKIVKSNKKIFISTLNIKYGISLPNSKREKGNIPLLASNGIIDYVSCANAENPIVFGCRGTLGNVFYQEGSSFVLNTAFYINNPKNYGNLFFALKYNNGLILYSSGAAQPQITIDSIKNASIKIPNDNVLNMLLDLYSLYQKQLSKMKEIKTLLLKKYF